MNLVGATIFDNGVVGGLSGKIVSVSPDFKTVDVRWDNRGGFVTVRPVAGKYSIRLVEEES